MRELLLAALLISIPLALLLSAGIGLRYRSALRRLMRQAPSPASEGDLPSAPPAPSSAPVWAAERPMAAVSLTMRERTLHGALALTSLLVGFTAASLYLWVHAASFGGVTPLRWLFVGLMLSTPGVVLQAQILRWSLRRQLAVLLLWGLSVLAILAITNNLSSAGMDWMLIQLLVPQLLLGALFGIPGLRAIAPYVLLPVLIVVLLALASLGLLMTLVLNAPQLIEPVVAITGRGFVYAVAMIPALLAALLAHRLSAWISRLYRRKLFSELSYLYGSSWLIVLVLQVLPGWNGQVPGPGPLLPLLAWLWIPLLFRCLPARLSGSASRTPPTLLVLRVFRRGGPMGWLFDHVVQRWRMVGPVLLISAADLATRTIEPDALVAFLERRLQERYISSDAQLIQQLQAIDRSSDHDGRWRVSEFCCYASTWKPTLEALLQQADVVLMDLRGFTAANNGCRHELRRIAESSSLRAAVLLSDERTDRNTAEQDLGRPGHTAAIHWVSANQRRIQAVDSILTPLLRPFASDVS
jgi:hypothetical protein